ncbi:MAG: hypothetical protein CVU64_04085 [Deltaproteobacteria bacterium HGW-Deltaproteobacteria-21]|nr:MAG: hypothetical protein CVU64_04085 [Deltaproteobacteria bacterium HGW-Deltaproteobacteria-21]
MGPNELEKALMPFERKLRAQKRLRRLLGVREVDSPTYERYILALSGALTGRNGLPVGGNASASALGTSRLTRSTT